MCFVRCIFKSPVEPLQCHTLRSSAKKVKNYTPEQNNAVERKYERPTVIQLLNICVFMIETIISNNHNIIIFITNFCVQTHFFVMDI